MKTSVKIFVGLAILFFLATPLAAQTDVVIAIDLSKSMDINDRLKYRFIGADIALTMFAFYGTDNRGGVVSFGDGASDVIKLEHLSADQFAKYKPILDRLDSEDWTELGQGLIRSKDMMGTSERKKSVILISDGKVEGNKNVRGVSAERAKEQAEKELWSAVIPGFKAARISVYTIGLFNEGQGDEKTLKAIAEQTGGFYTHVQNPEEFPQIYKRMLDDIDHPSGVAELTNGSSIVLTPFDRALIVLGPTGFVLNSPNNLSYSTDKETIDTPVKQRFFEYTNKTAILFLGRPDNIESNGQFWNGKWSVENLPGRGEATFISRVRLVRDPSLPKRREYFLNEFYPIQYQFITEPGVDAESILSKCRAQFILAARKPSNAPPVLEEITRQGNVFTGETLLKSEGDYIFTIKISYENGNVERWSQSENFHVSNIPLITLSSPTGPAYVGSTFRVEAQPGTFGTAGLPETRGLVDSSTSFSLRYGSDEPIPLPPSKQEAGIFRSGELEFAKAGDLEIQGLLDGKLLMQLPGPNGQDIFTPYKVKALVSKKLNVQRVFWRTALRDSAIWGSTLVSLFASALGIYGYRYQRPKFDRLDKATLMGQGQGVSSIRLRPAGLSEGWRKARWFTRRPVVSVGGPQSQADIKDPRMKQAKGRSVFEIGVHDSKYYITSNGALDVYLNSDLLAPNEPRLITRNNEVFIPDVGSFRFHN